MLYSSAVVKMIPIMNVVLSLCLAEPIVVKYSLKVHAIFEYFFVDFVQLL